jgi:glycosyltransferase involved in cell wall biosynthesis
MEQIPFSVAISVYINDKPDLFDRALESITFKQTIMPSEIVLVVDGPVPKAIEDVLVSYKAKFPIFNVIRLSQNGGLGNALKIAIDNCHNELIARMDSDDISIPNRFEQQLSYFKANQNVDIVGGNITEFVGCEENVIAKRIVPVTNEEITDYLKRRCPFNHMTVMYKKTAVLSSGGYMDLFWNEDYYLWVRMYQNNCVFANTGTVLVNVRVGKDMYRRRGGKKYFHSEKFLQKYMLDKKIIGRIRYCLNVTERYILQVFVPDTFRAFIFRKFARKEN